MKATFDPSKNAITIAEHGLSFTDFGAFGRINGIAHSIAFTRTPEGMRLIGFRRGHEKEIRRYE